MDDDIIQTILKVAKNIAPKYAFAHYTKEDLIQEAILMGMDAHKRWDGKRPFENFVANHISRRLKTFKRDKYFRPASNGAEISKAQKAKKNINSPEKITFDLPIKNRKGDGSYNEIFSEIDHLIPISLRKEYLKLRDGQKISAASKKKIIEIMKNGYKEKNG